MKEYMGNTKEYVKNEEICEKNEGNHVVSWSWKNFEICLYIDSET